MRRLVIVESPTKARKIAGYLGSNYIVESSRGHIRDLPQGGRRRARQVQIRAVGPARGQRRRGLRTALHHQPRQEEHRHRAQGPAQGRRRALSGHGRRPRGRGHRLAPAGDAQAEHPGQADGVPRDHRAGDPRGRRGPARPRQRPRRRAGDPPHPRPAVRLRGQPRAVEEGRAEAVGRPGAVGGDPHHRAARARADGVPQRRLLGHHRRAGRQRVRRTGAAADVHRQAEHRRRQAGGHRPRLRLAGRSSRSPTRCWSSTRPVRGALATGLRGAQLDGVARSSRSRTPAGRTRRS